MAAPKVPPGTLSSPLKEPVIPPAQLELMHSLGYAHESELEIITSTTPRSRARWKSPRGVMFGNEKWYPRDEIKRHLDARAADVDPEPTGAL